MAYNRARRKESRYILQEDGKETMTIRETHQTGIGGSQAAALLGVPSFLSRFDVYVSALGIAYEQAETFPMWLGKALEPIMAEAYHRRSGILVTDRGTLHRSKKFHWMLGHVDGLAGEIGVELKVAGFHNWREWGEEGQVPQAYYLQCQHYMVVTGLRAWDLCVLLGTEFKVYPVKYDEEIAQALILAESKAWGEIEALRALRKTDDQAFAARMSGLARTDEAGKGQMLGRVWPQTRGLMEPCPTEHLGLCARLRDTCANLRAEQGNFDVVKNEVKLALGEKPGWGFAGGRVRWVGKDGARKFFVDLDEDFKT